jgi:Ras family protein A
MTNLTDGPKCDAARSKIGALNYLECSAKTGEGVDRVVEAAARAALAQKKKKSRFKLFS